MIRFAHILWRHRGTLLLAMLAGAVASAPAYRSWSSDIHGRRDEAISVAMMSRRIPEVRLEGSTLVDTLEWLAACAQAPGGLVVEWDELGRVGVTPDIPVTMHARDVRLDKVVGAVLMEVSSDLKYTVDGGRLLISTERDLLRRSFARRYDVRDLVVTPANELADENPPRGTQTRDSVSRAICTLVEDIVAGHTWKRNGGEFADLRYERGWLIVTQTADNHRTVARLLEQLRQSRARPLRTLTGEYADPWH